MTLEEKQDVLADILDCDAGRLLPDADLLSLGWDSMCRVSLIAVLRTQFGRKVTGAELAGFKTVGDIFATMD